MEKFRATFEGYKTTFSPSFLGVCIPKDVVRVSKRRFGEDNCDLCHEKYLIRVLKILLTLSSQKEIYTQKLYSENTGICQNDECQLEEDV